MRDKVYINAVAKAVPGVDGVPGNLVPTQKTMAALGPLWNPSGDKSVGLDWAEKNLGFMSQALAVDPSTWSIHKENVGLVGDTELAILAGQQAMERSGVSPSHVDAVFHVSCTPSLPYCGNHFRELTKGLGLKPNVRPRHQNWGCAGLLPALESATWALRGGENIGRVLVIATNFPSGFMSNKQLLSHYSSNADSLDDWLAPVMFGDGAFAAVLSFEDNPGSFELVSLDYTRNGVALVDYPAGGSSNPTWAGNADMHRFIVYAKAVKTEFISGIRDSVSDMLSTWEYSIAPLVKRRISLSSPAWHNGFDHFIVHQANARLLLSLTDEMGIPRDKVPVVSNIYGNQSTAAIGVALCKLVEEERIRHGDLIPGFAVGEGGGKMYGWLLLRAT